MGVSERFRIPPILRQLLQTSEADTLEETSILAAQNCPFNTVDYVSGLTSIGVPVPHASGRFSLLSRTVAGTSWQDVAGPWPYLWVDGPEVLDALRDDFRHFLTVTVVFQPGYLPPAGMNEARLFKMHLVYDPRLPAPALSRRSFSRLEACRESASFMEVLGREERLEMANLYRRLVDRRGLRGSYVDFPLAHFESIADLPGSVFFKVADAAGTGAMACATQFGDMLQVLHMASTDEGLRWNASYLLMAGMQGFARDNGVRLLTGGMPDGAATGLDIFKARWANDRLPVHMLRIVNQPERYAALCKDVPSGITFFPAYRTPGLRAAAPLS